MSDHEHDFWATPFGPMKCVHCPATRLPAPAEETIISTEEPTA